MEETVLKKTGDKRCAVSQELVLVKEFNSNKNISDYYHSVVAGCVSTVANCQPDSVTRTVSSAKWGMQS
jgi:hypothetical protein